MDDIDVERNSVGLIRDMDADMAVVFFIGKKKLLKIHKDRILCLNIFETGKSQHGPEHNAKICNICHVLRDSEKFTVNQKDGHGRITRRPSCQKCRQVIDGMSMSKDAKKWFEQNRPEKGFIIHLPFVPKNNNSVCYCKSCT